MIFSELPYEINEMVINYLSFTDLITLGSKIPIVAKVIEKKYNDAYTYTYGIRTNNIPMLQWLRSYYEKLNKDTNDEILDAYGYALVNSCDIKLFDYIE